MDVEPATPPARSLSVAGLRRRRSRSPLIIMARRSAPARHIINDPELTAPPPPPPPTQSAASLRRRVHASEAAAAAWVFVGPGSVFLTESRCVASRTATPGQAGAAARAPPPTRTRAVPPRRPERAMVKGPCLCPRFRWQRHESATVGAPARCWWRRSSGSPPPPPGTDWRMTQWRRRHTYGSGVFC